MSVDAVRKQKTYECSLIQWSKKDAYASLFLCFSFACVGDFLYIGFYDGALHFTRTYTTVLILLKELHTILFFVTLFTGRCNCSCFQHRRQKVISFKKNLWKRHFSTGPRGVYLNQTWSLIILLSNFFAWGQRIFFLLWLHFHKSPVFL